MYRNTDCTGIICQSPGNCLADPPGRIGTELISLCIVKLIHGFHQSDISLLNQIQEAHATAHIPLGNTDNQTQIGFRQVFLGFFIAIPHPFRQLRFLFRGKQLNITDFFQILTHRIFNVDAIRNGQITFFYVNFFFIIQKELCIIIIIADSEYIDAFAFQIVKNTFTLLHIQSQAAESIHDFLVFKNILFLLSRRY